MSDVFAVGRTAAAPIATTMQTAAVLIIDTDIRCPNNRGAGAVGRPGSGGVCGKLLAERAARPHTHVCPRCGYRHDVPLPL